MYRCMIWIAIDEEERKVWNFIGDVKRCGWLSGYFQEGDEWRKMGIHIQREGV